MNDDYIPMPKCVPARRNHRWLGGHCTFCGMKRPVQFAKAAEAHPYVSRVKPDNPRADPLAKGYDDFTAKVPRHKCPYHDRESKRLWEEGYDAAKQDSDKRPRWREEFQEKLKGLRELPIC